MNLKQPSNKIEYYTLEYDPPEIPGYSPVQHVLKVSRFTVSPDYNTNQIIYRDKSFQRDSYAYHRWHANPGDLVTSFLSRDLRESGLFKAVLLFNSKIKPTIIIDGTVDEFYEYDAVEDWRAVLSLTITLIKEDEPDISKRIMLQKSYQVSEKCKDKRPEALAEAMSSAMSQISETIISDVYNSLK